MDIHLTSRHVWQSTLICGGLGIALLVPLVVIFRADAAFATPWPATCISALFWGTVAMIVVPRFWTLYYQYLYPTWMRSLTPLDLLLYGAIGLGMWALATRLPGPAVLNFVLLGGVEGIIEHVIGIYGLRILERVPWLQGLTAAPILIFSFFEYILYWALVAWLALGLVHLLT